MFASEDGSRGAERSKKLAGAVAVLAGLTGLGVAAVAGGPTPLVATTPTATAGTATPWVPRPHFGAQEVPKPETHVGARGSEPQQANPNAAWVSEAKTPFQDVQRAMSTMYETANEQNIAGMQAACRRMDNAAQRLGNTLPAPSDALTAEAQGVVDEVAALASACVTDPPDLNVMDTHAKNVQTHIQNTGQLLEGG